jgi:hypothetical protein
MTSATPQRHPQSEHSGRDTARTRYPLRLRRAGAAQGQKLELQGLVPHRRHGRRRRLDVRGHRRRGRVRPARRTLGGRRLDTVGTARRVAYRAAIASSRHPARRAGVRRSRLRAGVPRRCMPIGTQVGGVHRRAPLFLAVVVPQMIVARDGPVAAARHGPARRTTRGATTPAIIGAVPVRAAGQREAGEQGQRSPAQQEKALHGKHSHCGYVIRITRRKQARSGS